jgi:hypothetical protein
MLDNVAPPSIALDTRISAIADFFVARACEGIKAEAAR